MCDLCRTCGNLINNGNPQDLFKQAERTILNKITLLTGYCLLEAFEISTLICQQCELSLHEAITFRDSIIKTQQLLPSNSFKAAVAFVPVGVDYNATKSNPNNEQLFDESLAQMDKTLLSVSSENVFRLNCDDKIMQDELQHNDDYSSEESINSSQEDELMADAQFDNTENDLSECNAGSDHGSESQKEGDILTTTPPTTKNGAKLKRQRGNYICEQCGRHFEYLSNLKLHILRHTGIKNYACELCEDKFYSSHLLRRHILKHRGVRLFPCRHCSKAFNNPGGRLKHERNQHTQFKPYKCTQCCKAFPLGGQLKRHMLTHTTVRAFRCELCDKSFVCRPTLVQHFRSQKHKVKEKQQITHSLSSTIL